MFRTTTIQKIYPAIDTFDHYFSKHYVSPSDIKCFRMIVEDVIVAYKEKCGCDKFAYSLTNKRRKVAVTLAFKGESYAVFEDKYNILIRNVMTNISGKCSWEYKKGKNFVRIEFDTPRSLAQSLLYLGKFIKEEKVRVTEACVLQMIGIAICVIIPILTAKLISNFTLGNIAAIIITIAVLFVVRVVNDFVVYFANRLHNAAYNKIRQSIEMELSTSIMSMEVNTIEKHGTGMIIQRMTNDTVALACGVESLVNQSFTFINYVGVLAAIFLISPGAFTIKLISVIALILIQSKKSKTQNKNERAYRTQNDRYSDIVGEMVHGNKDIKLLNSEKHFIDKLENIIKETNQKHLHLWNTSQNYTILSNQISNILEVCFYLVIALYLSFGSIEATDAVVLFNYSLNLVGVSVFIGDFLNYIKSMGLSSERVYQLVNDREFTREEFGEKRLDNFSGEVEFRDVDFAYAPSEIGQKPTQVLKGLNLKIHAGETVAFVGKSGCGKTTALNLISKLYTPNSGAVLFDGVDISELDKDTIRGNISVVSQSPYVFNMSIKENLRLIKPDLTDEEMVSLCRDACIHDEILNFPQGYDTIVGEGGTMLSGGQRQRLALARGMLKNNRIILLDEATSALDNVTQAHIQETINRVKHKKTVIIVAHRLSTIKVCDRIFYFSDGRVLAQGSHEQMMETCPEYRELYMSE